MPFDLVFLEHLGSKQLFVLVTEFFMIEGDAFQTRSMRSNRVSFAIPFAHAVFFRFGLRTTTIVEAEQLKTAFRVVVILKYNY